MQTDFLNITQPNKFNLAVFKIIISIFRSFIHTQLWCYPV